MNITTYNPRKVTCSLGNHIVKGFADDSFITVEPAGDGTQYVVGADGEVARSIDPSAIYTVKISLLQASATNAFLQKMSDKDSKNGKGTFSITIKDILGKDKFTSKVCWVSKTASWARGKTQNNREWELVAAEGKFKYK